MMMKRRGTYSIQVYTEDNIDEISSRSESSLTLISSWEPMLQQQQQQGVWNTNEEEDAQYE